MPNPEEVRLVPRILANGSVRLVIVEPLQGTLLMELTSGLKTNLRSSRYPCASIESTTFGAPCENATRSEVKPNYNRRTDEFAASYSIPRAELENFIARVRPLFSKQKIREFAHRVGVHPGIVVGQLHRTVPDVVPYSHNREMLVKVRNIVTAATLTDGWGHHAPAL